MGINFNGEVTINGNVEIYDNGSMKITGNQLNINVNDLSSFIQENFKYSPNKEEYLEVAETLKNSSDPDKIKLAFSKLKNMTKELGKSIMFAGLSQVVLNVIKNTLTK